MKTNQKPTSTFYLTLLLLSVGYFIDYYDLTIFSGGYVHIINDLFGVFQADQVQLIYLKIERFYLFGIFLGGISFGILGDKLGRATTIKYSILLYSLATLAVVFVHQLSLFILLRFIAGFCLSSEFATSSVLISESLPQEFASRSIGILTFCGVMGGIFANFIDHGSWRLAFILGGSAGLLLYLARSSLIESPLFKANLNKNQKFTEKLKLGVIFSTFSKVRKFIRLLVMFAPYYLVICFMFLYPQYMSLKIGLADAVHTLLYGFFIGNLASILLATYLINRFKSYKSFLLLSVIFFAVVMSTFRLIPAELYSVYTFAVGLFAGGYPVAWVQLINRSYGTEVRNTATNSLLACGRFLDLGFNFLSSLWIVNHLTFSRNAIMTVLAVAFLAILAIILTRDNYNAPLNYFEESKDD